MAVAVPVQPGANQALALGLKYGPNSGVALSRSQYLADALAAMQQSGSQNVRTPTALWSNLLATGLMQYSKDRADKDAMSAYTSDQKTLNDSLLAGTPLDPAAKAPAIAQAAPSPDAVAPTVATPPAPAAVSSSPLGPAAPAVPSGPALASALEGGSSPKDLDAAARMMLSEAGGEGPEGMTAAGAVAFNRLHKHYGGAQTLADVVNAPHQFEGMTSPRANVPTTDPNYQKALALAQGLANGSTPDPTGGAMNFLNPVLQTQLGRPQPSWAPAGQGQRIGNHVFYGANPQMAQNGGAPPPPPPPPDPNGPPVQNVQPYQVAANGPTPAPPMAAGPPPAAPGSLPPNPAAGGMAPPRQMVTPEEWQTAYALLQNPQTMAEGRAKILDLKMKAASMPSDPSKPYWGPDGRAHYAPGMEYRQADGPTPSTRIQTGPDGKQEVLTFAGKQGAVPEGKVYDAATGGYVAISGGQPRALVDPKERASWGIPSNDHNSYAIGADGKVVKTADSPYGPREIQSMRDNFFGADETKKYFEGLSAYKAFTGLLGKADNNGIFNTAGVDSYLRGINPGMGAKNSTVSMFLEHQGWPAELKGTILNATGNGYLTPETINHMVQTIHEYTTAHRSVAQSRADQDAAFAARQGYRPEDLGETLPEVPGMPSPYTGKAGSSVSHDDVISQARQAIAAGRDRNMVINRVRAAGIDPRGL